MPKERLDKILASQNRGSRREAGAMIRRGLVTVNGAAVVRPEAKCDPEADMIAVEGAPLAFQRFVFLMMNKPPGVLSASRDSRSKTVLDLLPPALCRRGLFPAGRLDRDTEGLLILTDDGAFAHKMLAPKSHVFKVYHALLDLPIDAGDQEAFAAGLELWDRTCLPAELLPLPPEKAERGGPAPGRRVQVKICEGKFHQVKKMFEARGKTVLSLKRVQIGRLRLDAALRPGEARPMTAEEVKMIFL